MKCPECMQKEVPKHIEMQTMPLKAAIKKGLVNAKLDEDVPESMLGNQISNSSFCVCPSCGFYMTPDNSILSN